jgi:hypothetical protein
VLAHLGEQDINVAAPAGNLASSANHRTTCRSRCAAAWSPPATLGFIAAASASANTPITAGGELTQP